MFIVHVQYDTPNHYQNEPYEVPKLNIPGNQLKMGTNI